ncbi:hypothetical protein J7M23_08850 [Candidatus Sumerlaeota bacterium]|nr:hypothetical protein [Candidatus Sumerlaeota bacterium]
MSNTLKKGMCIVFLSLIVLGTFSAEKTVLLRYHFAKGDKFLIKGSTTMQMVQTMMGEETKMDTVVKQTVKCEVVDVKKDGTAVIKTKFDSIYFKMSSPQMTLEYDSSKKQSTDNPMLKVFDFMMTEPITFEMNPLGKIVEIKGLDSLLEKAIESMNIEQPAMKKQMRDMMQKMIGDKHNQFSTKSFVTFPENPVKPGDTWNFEQEIQIISPTSFKTEYKLVELKNNVASIESKMTIKPGEESKPTQFGNLSLQMNISGEITGIQKIDLKTGLIIDSSQTYNFHGTMKGTMPPQQEITIPISYKGTTTAKMVKI